MTHFKSQRFSAVSVFLTACVNVEVFHVFNGAFIEVQRSVHVFLQRLNRVRNVGFLYCFGRADF